MDERIVYGVHAVAALVSAGRARKVLVSASVSGGKAAGVEKEAHRLGADVERVSPARIERLAEGRAHQGIVAYRADSPGSGAGQDWRSVLEAAQGGRTALALDRIEDPRNLGACLRTAAAFGVDCALLPRHRSAPLGPAARKAAAGAAERLPVFRVGNLPHVVEETKRMGFFVCVADVNAPDAIGDAELPQDVVLVVGGEAHGPRKLFLRKADLALRIPIRPESESLNVSVAAGIFLHELSRRRAGPAEG